MDGPERSGHHLRVCAAVALLACMAGCGDSNDNAESERTPTATATITSTPKVTPFIGTITTTRTPSAAMTPSPTRTPTAATTPAIQDLSLNITDFEIQRTHRPGLAFCPPLDEIFHAKVSRGDDGVYRLDVSVLEPTTRNDPRCLEHFSGDVDCAREVVLPKRDLSTEERFRIVDASRAVAIFPEPDALCQTIAFDPCLVTELHWTIAVGDVSGLDRLTFNATDYRCFGDRLPESEVQRFVALIEALR